VVGLQWNGDPATADVAWALDVGEAPVLAFYDKMFLSYEPHGRHIRQ